jgi:ATP-dependent Lon protease
LVSGGQASKATLFYNNARKRVGLVGFWDNIAFDEVAGIKIRDPEAIQIMKDFMANGRFSRGAEIIADASLSFVGNIDHSIEQLVASTEHDLFISLPKELDLAVMDRFASYLPGWEMPKTGSSLLTQKYGFITDYLAEAFHYSFASTNRYEEVTKRVKLGSHVEGRDEKGIKKTLCALLKILHPGHQPSDVEFDEYVAYAVEMRRRVKEQMNKRKPDDEFANLSLSFVNSEGEEVIVHCPESHKVGTRVETKPEPIGKQYQPQISSLWNASTVQVSPARIAEVSSVVSEPEERHFTIRYGETGFSFDTILGDYLRNANEVLVEDPYIRLTHQVQNLVRFCETIVRRSNIRTIKLITAYDDLEGFNRTKTMLEDLAQSLLEHDIKLEFSFNPKMHDREIRIDNGWTIKIGRGLDFYQKPNSYFDIGSNDLTMRKCLETKVDIFRSGSTQGK